LGEKVLSYLEPVLGPVVSPYKYRGADGKDYTGASCSAMAMLLRASLEHSFANPAVGTDGGSQWIRENRMGLKWDCVCIVFLVLPFICAHGLSEGGMYSLWGIVSCVMSSLSTVMYLWQPPQGFTMGAIFSVRRKTQMFTFMNSLLLANRDEVDALGCERDPWHFSIHLTNPANICLWRKCREVVSDFGHRYSLRTECNAGIMMLYVAIFTVLTILWKSISRQKVSFSIFCFPILLHLGLVTIMCAFSIALALEGEECNETAVRAKSILSASAITLEKRRFAYATHQQHQFDATHRAMAQLQEFLTTEKDLKPAEILYFIQLDKTLVVTIVFALLTQYTLIFDNVNLD
jgi:hypothetical protein